MKAEPANRRIHLKLGNSLVEAIDQIRGETPRTVWIKNTLASAAREQGQTVRIQRLRGRPATGDENDSGNA